MQEISKSYHYNFVKVNNYFFYRSTTLLDPGLFYEIPQSDSVTQHSVRLFWTCDLPVAETSTLYPTTSNTRKKETFMLPEEFEPAIPSSDQPQTHTLDGAATGNGLYLIHHIHPLYLKSAINFCEGTRTQNMKFNIYVLNPASEI